MKKIFTLFVLALMAIGANAKVDVNTLLINDDGETVPMLECKAYAFGSWGGTWSPRYGIDIAQVKNAEGVYMDWSDYDYIWIEYSGLTGPMQFGLSYSEYQSMAQWGPVFDGVTTLFSGESGVLGVKIEKNKTYVNGLKTSDDGEGQFIGEDYAKHILQIFIQATYADASITIENVWVGSELEYLEAIGYNTRANHLLQVSNGEAGANAWDRQVVCTLNASMEEGKTYIVRATILTEAGGSVQLVPIFSTSENRDQWGNSADVQYLDGKTLIGSDEKATKVVWEFKAAFPHDKLQFFIGSIAGDLFIDNVSCIEKESEEELVDNGDFEFPDVSNWNVLSYAGQTMQHIEMDDLVSFLTYLNHVLEVNNGEAPAEHGYERQAIHVLDEPLVVGKTYIVKVTICSESGGEVQLAPIFSDYTEENAAPLFGSRMNALENGVQYLDIAAIEAGKSSRVTWKFIAEAPFDKLQFFIGSMSGKVIFDDVSCMEENGDTELIVNGDFEEEGITNWTVLSWAGQTMIQAEADVDDPISIDATPTTGIATPTAISADQPAVRYDLSGRRVDASYKGVVIMNGKKTVNN